MNQEESEWTKIWCLHSIGLPIHFALYRGNDWLGFSLGLDGLYVNVLTWVFYAGCYDHGE